MAFTIIAALLAVTLRNILHAIFGLAVALFGIAGIFLILNSPFIAAMEVLIYVGGISVAMVFAVMLSTVVGQRDDGIRRRILAGMASLAFFVVVAGVITKADFGPDVEQSAQSWSVVAIGGDLLTHYNVVFELLSVVLLLAIVGAIAISRRQPRRAAPVVAPGAAALVVEAVSESVSDGESEPEEASR